MEHDHVFPVLMNGQADNGVRLVVHGILEETPTGLWRAHVPCVEELLHLVVCFHLHCGPVVSFISVFIKVFNGLDGGAELHSGI